MNTSYTENDLEMESFIRIPMAFIDDEHYNKLSAEAMIVYGLFDRRLRLSKINKKNWTDKNGHIYIIYTNEELCKKLRKSKPLIIKIKRELAELGLIIEKRQGLQKPNLIYPQKVRSKKSLLQEVKNIDFIGSKKSLLQEVKNIDSSKKDNSEIDISKKDNSENVLNNNNTNNIYSVFEQAFGRLLTPFEIEDISHSVREFGEELVTYALKETVMNNKLNMKYINGIFNNWRKEGVKTLEQVEENNRNRKRSRKTERDYEYDPQYDLELIARGEV